MEKTKNEAVLAYFSVLSQHLSERAEENHGYLLSRYSYFRPKFEREIS
jgi:hypothetical protein